MALFSIFDRPWDRDCAYTKQAYDIGSAIGWLTKTGAAIGTSHYLSGRLYVSKTGWLLLSVPNALVRGVFDAISATGVELPTLSAFKGEAADGDTLDAHITVMTGDEVAKIGANKINERGHHFHYGLGQVREFSPKTEALSRVWAIQVTSPELSELRKSYGLTPLPYGDHQFHITVAVRRKNVLGPNEVAKIDGTRGELKAAAEQLPWRERAEVYARDPNTGKLYGGKWDNDGSFALPGGGIDPGEDPAQAGVRELEEETGIKAINPRLLPVPPVESPWSDKVRAEKAKQGRGGFAGSRTYFVTADVAHHPENANLDYWAAVDRGYYDPAEALAIMKGVKKYSVPSIAAARMAAINHLIAEAAKKQAAAAKEILHGGLGDGKADSEFSPSALAEGTNHEREHTDQGQIAKEIAKDHLSEDPAYYEKVKSIEKGAKQNASVLAQLRAAKEHSDKKRYDQKNQILRRLMTQAPQDWVVDSTLRNTRGVTHTPTKFKLHTLPTVIPPSVKAAIDSVYLEQAKQQFNPFRVHGPILYDHNKPVFENIRNQVLEAKRRGDFILQAERNHRTWRSAMDPRYRQQIALQAVRGTLPKPSYVDQAIERYGDQVLSALPGG